MTGRGSADLVIHGVDNRPTESPCIPVPNRANDDPCDVRRHGSQ